MKEMYFFKEDSNIEMKQRSNKLIVLWKGNTFYLLLTLLSLFMIGKFVLIFLFFLFPILFDCSLK